MPSVDSELTGPSARVLHQPSLGGSVGLAVPSRSLGVVVLRNAYTPHLLRDRSLCRTTYALVRAVREEGGDFAPLDDDVVTSL